MMRFGRIEAFWELVEAYWRDRGLNPDELRLQRSVEAFQRIAWPVGMERKAAIGDNGHRTVKEMRDGNRRDAGTDDGRGIWPAVEQELHLPEILDDFRVRVGRFFE
jgi:hypothetical protein